MEDPEQRRPKNANYGVCGFWCLMMLFIVIAALVFTIVYLTLISKNTKGDEITTTAPPPVETGVCNTPECATLASSLIQRMDTTINPCRNFYDYACGNWIKNTHIPEGYGRIDTIGSKMDRELDLKILLEAPEMSDEPEAIQKAKSLYKSCMNKEKREENGITVINTGVETVFGGWPVLGNNLGGKFNEQKYNFTTLLTGLFVDAGSTSLLRAIVRHDSQLVITAGTLTGLPSEEYLVDDKYRTERDAYVKYMTDVAILLGAHPDVATPEMLAVLDLEQQLARAKLESSPTPDKYSTIAELRDNYAGVSTGSLQIGWTQFLRRLVPESVEITDDFVVINYDSEYLKKAVAILENVPKRLVADWMLWLCFHDATLYLNDAIRNARYEFEMAVYGTLPRDYYKDCVDITARHLKSATSRLYADKFFSMETKSSVEVIVESIKKVQEKLVDKSNSFAREAKETVESMLMDAAVRVGLPEYVMDNDLLDNEYENLADPGDDIFVNFLSVLSFRVKENAALLSEENTYQNRSGLGEQHIGVLPEVAQPPFFNQEWPWYLNYGNLGMIIARDLTAAIAPTENINAEIQECLQNQYSNFHLSENGQPVQGNLMEIIGDNAGLQIATKAFMDQQGSQDMFTLPGLDLTISELFFLNNAQLWCEQYTPKYAAKLDTAEQTPGRFRVNGMMQNSVAFSKAFECPPWQDMNPENKCIVY